MPFTFFSLCLLLASSLFAQMKASEELAQRRIQDHLLLKDFSAAAKEGKQFAEKYPESFPIQHAYLKALCAKGDEDAAFVVVKKIRESAQLHGAEKEIFEMLAWSVLTRGDNSSLLMIRLYSLLGAAFTSDAKALSFLQKEMLSSNALLRSIAVRIAPNYGDQPLRQALLKMLKEEKVWYIRLDVIQALGRLREQNATESLKKIIANPKTYPEEKAAAIIALTSMSETVEDSEINRLIHSDRAGLRELAVELITFWDLSNKLVDLLPLLSDPSPPVRVCVLNALALSGKQTLCDKPLIVFIKPLLQDPSPDVAITAAWLCTLLNDRQGLSSIESWIKQPVLEWKMIASGALAACGAHGAELSFKLMQTEEDPLVKANLALGLLSQRHYIDSAGEALFALLTEGKEKYLMWQNQANPLFRSLAPSKIRHIEQIPRYPEAVDKQVRLELLSVLSMVGHPKALIAIRQCLKDPNWGVSSTAMMTLLEQGDEQSFEIVRNLICDPDPDIQLQAALILALYGKDPAAIETLKKAYSSMDREKKVHVLEALAKVADVSSLPFLLEILEDPFQLLRIIAASAMIQCLYH